MRLSGNPSGTWGQTAHIGSIHANQQYTKPLSISIPARGLLRGQYIVELLDLADGAGHRRDGFYCL